MSVEIEQVLFYQPDARRVERWKQLDILALIATINGERLCQITTIHVSYSYPPRPLGLNKCSLPLFLLKYLAAEITLELLTWSLHLHAFFLNNQRPQQPEKNKMLINLVFFFTNIICFCL